MTTKDTPRVRSLLRQAQRNVEGGKYVAAEQLYRQIVAEAPQSASAWLGLATVAQSEADRSEAYARALEINPDIEAAAVLEAEPSNDPESEQTTDLTSDAAGDQNVDQAANPATIAVAAPEVNNETAVTDEQHGHRYEVVDADAQLFCYRHPGRSTSLRCYKCNKPICSECTVKTPVGYLCPDCYREAEDAFFNARPTDYILAIAVALPISLLAGFLVMQFSRGIFFIIIMFFVGGAIGGVIGRITKRVIGGRRGRYIPHLVAACVIIGVLVWALPVLLFNPGALFSLIGPGVYLATAVGSAFYWAR